jgi:hypothetical protein
MSFAKTLLAGAALCALAASSALANHAPPIRLEGVKTPLKMIMNGHFKTIIKDKKTYTNVTTTATFDGTITESVFYEKPTLLWAQTWVNTDTCVPFATEKGKFSQRTAAAKITNGSVTSSLPSGTCPGTKFKFFGPVYDLKSTTADSDSFTGNIIVKHTSTGYNLDLIAHTDLNITH